MRSTLGIIIENLKKENLLIDFISDIQNVQEQPEIILDTIIAGKICTDSKIVQDGDIFVCIKGFITDGHSYAPQAFEKGAKLLIVNDFLDLPINQIKVSESRKATAVIAKVLYDDPTAKFDLIGVTGTNGKTTTTYILEQLFKKQYEYSRLPVFKTVGVIGTIGYKIGDDFYPSERTTPDIVELNEIFSKMIKAGCKIVIMEVSSHALALYRVYGLHFKYGIFTNLSQDHLDFHRNMLEYGNAKLTLFEMVQNNNGFSVVNIDDPFGHKIFKRITSNKAGFSICPACQMPVKDSNAEYWNISDIELSEAKSSFNLFFKNEILATKFDRISISLPGKFNIQNMTSALIVLFKYIQNSEDNIFENNEVNQGKINKIYSNFNTITGKVIEIQSASGRMEKIIYNKKVKVPNIYIDYAHTPDALENILKAAREFTKNRVICVWGCGGNRDKSKRSQMAKISVHNADLTIITNDNPRLESPADIIRDIVSNVSWQEPFFIVRDRREAIKTAIMLAHEDDTVIIAGKGHETYQEIGSVKYHFDDKEEVMKVLDYRDKVIDSPNKYRKKEELAVSIDLLMLEKIFNLNIDNSFLFEDNTGLFNMISTDSRQVRTKSTNKTLNSLFIAINGENFDGADFVSEVLNCNNNNWCIVNNNKQKQIQEQNKNLTNEYNNKKQIIFVDDSISAYGKIAQKYLQLFNLKKIALTGSTGKTTTKEILFNIFSERFKTFKTHKNENNRIGIPKIIFNLDFNYECAIFETGTNQFGEINALAEIIKPHLGIIINVNPSHLEYLQSVELIMQEKMSMLNHVTEKALIPSSKKFARFLKEFSSKKIFTFSIKSNVSFCSGDSPETSEDIYDDSMQYLMKKVTDKFECEVVFDDNPKNETILKVNNDIYRIKSKIPYYCTNYLISICAAKLFNIENHQIQAGLDKDLLLDNRMEVLKSGQREIIFDCYNANPYSMKAAISFWSSLREHEYRIAIIGDMLELGEKSREYHQEIGNLLNDIKNKQRITNDNLDIKTIIIGIGKDSEFYKPDYQYHNINEFIKVLESDTENKILPLKGLYLIKASHGLKLEKLKGLL